MTWLETAGILCAATFFLLFWTMLEFCLKLTKQIREARVDLAKLRRRGVELRNFGQTQIGDDPTFDKWVSETLQWEKAVVKSIGKISMADAEWFEIIDSYPDKPREPLKRPFVRGSNHQDHTKRYEQHDFQLMRLGEMIRDL